MHVLNQQPTSFEVSHPRSRKTRMLNQLLAFKYTLNCIIILTHNNKFSPYISSRCHKSEQVASSVTLCLLFLISFSFSFSVMHLRKSKHSVTELAPSLRTYWLTYSLTKSVKTDGEGEWEPHKFHKVSLNFMEWRSDTMQVTLVYLSREFVVRMPKFY